jgi:hypothetical protein
MDEIPALTRDPRLYRLNPQGQVELCKPEVTGSIPVRSILDLQGFRPKPGPPSRSSPSRADPARASAPRSHNGPTPKPPRRSAAHSTASQARPSFCTHTGRPTLPPTAAVSGSATHDRTPSRVYAPHPPPAGEPRLVVSDVDESLVSGSGCLDDMQAARRVGLLERVTERGNRGGMRIRSRQIAFFERVPFGTAANRFADEQTARCSSSPPARRETCPTTPPR